MKLAQSDGLADFLLVDVHGDETKAFDLKDERYISAEKFIELLEESALVQWSDGVPNVAREEFARLREHEADILTADVVGLRWLTTLSYNKLPWALRNTAASPDDWFERIFFRVATGPLRFKGQRLGTAGRGERVVDGLLLPSNQSLGILYDCKAARDGYTMIADHERRLVEYGKGAYEMAGDSVKVGTVAVVSSFFPGQDGPRHPFYERQRAIKEQSGLDLAYVRAADIVALILHFGEQNSTVGIDSIDWESALQQGLVTFSDLMNAAGVQ